MLCLTFHTLVEAQAANNKIWVNLIKDRASQGDGLVGLPDDPYTTDKVQSMSDLEIHELIIYGFHQGKIDTTNGFTIKWADIKKAFDQDLWYILKPADEFMADVTGHTAQLFNSEWEETGEEI